MTNPPKSLRATLFLVLLGCLSMGETRALADSSQDVARNDLSSKFTVDERDPERSVPTPSEAMKNPLEMGYFVMDLIARAESAMQRGEHAAAVRYYRAIAKAAPERSVSYSKLCHAYEAMGDLKNATDACREALGHGGVTVSDYVKFVQLALRAKGELQTAQREEVEAVLAHVREQLKSDPQGPKIAAEIDCEIASRLEDEPRLSRCTKQLAEIAPAAATTLTFRWALALLEHDLEGAAKILAEAKAAKLPWQATHDMEEKLKQAQESVDLQAGELVRGGVGVAFALIIAAMILIPAIRRKPSLRGAA